MTEDGCRTAARMCQKNDDEIGTPSEKEDKWISAENHGVDIIPISFELNNKTI